MFLFFVFPEKYGLSHEPEPKIDKTGTKKVQRLLW